MDCSFTIGVLGVVIVVQRMGGGAIFFPFNALFVNVAFPLLLLVKLQLSLVYLIPARADHQSSYYCGQNQFCGELNISYPFFNDNWGCGLERLHCLNVSTPVIHAGADNDVSNMFEVHKVDYTNNTVLTRYRKFTQDLLTDNDKCHFLFNNFTTIPPIFHHLLTQVISPNLTLRVCINKLHDHHHQEGLINDCKVEALQLVPAPPPATILDYQNTSSSSSSSSSSSYDCKLVHLPVDPLPSTFQYGPIDPISQLFIGGFRLRWILPQICHHCEKNGTFCVRYDDETVFCSNPKTWNPDTGIPAGVAAGILLTTFLFFIVYKYRTDQYNHGSVSHRFSLKTDLEKGSSHYGVPIFSCAELEEATNHFSSVNELGDGASGTVYHGKLRDGRVVAIKRLYRYNSKHVERFMNEIEILTRLRHQNLVTLYGCTSYHSHELLLVYEFIPNGTVADHLHGDTRKVGSLPWPVRMSIALQTATALSYLHTSDIIHRDVKTSNILLDNHFQVKVADFGLCRMFPNDASHVSTAPQGTPGYVDPEYHQCYQLTDKSDVYSFGVVLIELISSKPAVDITRHRDEINLANMAMNKIQNGALQELVDPCLVGFESDSTRRKIVTLVAELAFRCLQHEKELRPSMDKVLEILMGIGGEDINLPSYNDEHLPAKNMNIPALPPASPDLGTQKLISPLTMPSTSG
ncbi:LEAF RUST 10 DISEASE-RESISTANCE LOCUS RECEPTOR-LIKE PROTEIN KINASE-like 1.1 [Telopea speciosissima]|uniref:LEAF RUST 10 DISEASE-RESISTANCE LOCUS RECEPTOR-LIKE PROTEIN KINASE-like 1.1 n=1 Tax=Telopea speciosissima TaxID=54955 RepID=UPI001CC3411D|nr:LEAF RUST 10 DISEASE-RESISTANCE LOCUS RECEPTOR-LIKE PROTEIN KINASE-like 1.1 [Telopea speciosissima]